jgi:hypothetical protein
MSKAKTILSLCDHSGTWCKPYRDAGYNVIQIDLKLGDDIRLIEFKDIKVHGIMCAPPCTDFSVSGAQYWPAKDADGRTLQSLALVDACLRAVAIYSPNWWVLENPVGRLRRWIGPPAYSFNPCDFGGYLGPDESSGPLFPNQDAYTKKTLLWGKFNEPIKKAVTPVFLTAKNGDKYCPAFMKTGGKSERTKELRSVTPKGFAQAFFEVNP